MEPRIIDKPWGREELYEKNDKYMVKKLVMKTGARCSLQYHKKKCETLYVISGVLDVTYGSSEKTLQKKRMVAGNVMTLLPGTLHRMEAIEEAVYLEASTPELDDVVRIADDYNRV